MPNSNPSSMYGPPNFIVDPTPGKGSHTTISAAMAAASSPANIYIRPGTYTENVTGKAGVNLIAFTGDSSNATGAAALVTLNGTYSVTFAGSASISGINFTTNTTVSISISGSNSAIITLQDCSFIASNNVSISHAGTNSRLILRDCYSDLTASTGVGFIAQSGLVTEVYGHKSNNSGLSASGGITHTAGTFNAWNSTFIMIYSASGVGTILGTNYCYFETALTNSNTITQQGTSAISSMNFTTINSGTGSSIVLGTGSSLNLCKCSIVSSNANPITQLGAATISYDDITFNSNSNINVTTQGRFKQSNQYLNGITFDNTNILQNYSTGTFTPVAYGLTVGGAATYSVQAGTYTRIGNRVCAQFYVAWTTHTGSGILGIAGLPFTSANTGIFNYASGFFYNNANVFDVLYQIQPNQTQMFLLVPGAGPTNFVACGSNLNIQCTIWYQV